MNQSKIFKRNNVMAVIMGVFWPAAETVRRSNQLLDPSAFFRWFDDYLLGAFLIAAAIYTLKNKKAVNTYMVAAWGIGFGAQLISLCGQLADYSQGISDHGVFSSGFVLIAKTVIFVYLLIGLFEAIKINKGLKAIR